MSLRSKIGLVAGVLLLAAVVSYPLSFFQLLKMPFAAAMRLGIVLSLLFLAWDDLARYPRWLYLTVAVTACVAAIYPWSLLVVVPIVVLWLYLRSPHSHNRRQPRA